MDVFNGFAIGLIVIVGVFLLLREFWCWYWKINTRVALLTKQNSLLELIASRLDSDYTHPPASVNSTETQEESKEVIEGACPDCGFVNDRADNYCAKCSYPLND